MSKKSNEIPKVGWGSGYITSYDTPDTFTGKILTIIEALGLNERQEESTKSLIRGAIWEIVRENMIYISSERHTELRNEYYKWKEEQRKSGADKVPSNGF